MIKNIMMYAFKLIKHYKMVLVQCIEMFCGLQKENFKIWQVEIQRPNKCIAPERHLCAAPPAHAWC